MKKKVDIIVSCYNEEDNIFAFYNEAIKYLTDENYIYNIVYVNDGSTDKTYEKIIELKKKIASASDADVANKNHDNNKKVNNVNVSTIGFVHNFGHEAAMCAGIDKSDADYMIIMDVDLQNPPSKIPEIIKKLEEGADCVLLRRVKYNSASLLKKITSNGYYLFSKFVLRNKNARNVSDFFAIDRNLAAKVRDKYRTRLRFIRSFVQFEAKNIVFVNYENAARNSGESRYNYMKLTKLAITSELSRSKFLRDKYKETNENPIYLIDDAKTV